MNDEFETIDTAEMEILAEFPTRVSEKTDAYRLGVAGENFILSGHSLLSKNKSDAEMSEREIQVFEYARKRNFWSGKIFFELENFDAVLQRLQEIFDGGTVAPLRKNGFDIARGKDLIAIEKNSVMPHNAGQPIETLLIGNQRPANLDLLKSNGFTIYLAPENGLKLLAEMRNIKPAVEKIIREKLG